MRSLFNVVRGVLGLFLFILNVLLFPIFVLLFAGFCCLLPFKSWRLRARSVLAHAPWPWSSINSSIMAISNGRKKWDVQLPDGVENNKPYLLICNHQTWIDIMVLFKIFNYGIQPIKFFMKKELLWSLPMAGLACKAIGFPFLERHSSQAIRKNPSLRGKDIATTRACCRRFMQIPSSLMIFCEGTRYTPKKAAKQSTPFEHLLKPKAGGASIVLEEMHDHLAGIIDVTIHYDTDDIGFWNFVKGGFRKISVRSRLIAITPDLIGNYNDDRQFRVQLQQWLNQVWQHKEKTMKQLDQSCHNKH